MTEAQLRLTVLWRTLRHSRTKLRGDSSRESRVTGHVVLGVAPQSHTGLRDRRGERGPDNRQDSDEQTAMHPDPVLDLLDFRSSVKVRSTRNAAGCGRHVNTSGASATSCLPTPATLPLGTSSGAKTEGSAHRCVRAVNSPTRRDPRAVAGALRASAAAHARHRGKTANRRVGVIFLTR